MVAGVFCEVKKEKVSFEYCMSCSECLPTPIIKSLRTFNLKYERNVYYLSEILGCLRKSYYNRKENHVDRLPTLKELYSRKRGKLFGKITESIGWQELPGYLLYKIDREDVKLTARLDCYDYEKSIVIELKSSSDIVRKSLPREKDILQVQCYGVIFKEIFPEIKGLKIVYLDMKNFKQYDVEQIDRTEWMEERVFTLHRAIRDSEPPERESSYECKFCPHKKKCSIPEPIISTIQAVKT